MTTNNLNLNLKRFTKDRLRQTIAKHLRNARASYEPKLTQEDVAQMFNPPVTRAAVAQWEVGEALPDIDRIALLSKAYGCTIDALVFGDDHPPNPRERELPSEAVKLARAWMKLDRKNRALVLTIMLSLK